MHRLVVGVERVDKPLGIVGVRVAVLVLGARRLLEGDLRGLRHERGELVRVGERIVHHAADVLDYALRRHLPERHDVGHVVSAVLLRDELEHLAAPRVVEVDVDIGHGDAVGVQEPLEQQVVLDRIDVRDAERVRDGRACSRTAPRTDPHAHLPGVGDVVVDDEEVAREAHRLDDPELEVDALDHLGRRRVSPAPLHPLVDERLQVVGLELDPEHLVVAAEPLEVLRLVLGVELRPERRLVEPLGVLLLAAELGRYRKLRHDRIGVEFVLLDHVRHLLRRVDDFRMVGEEGAHLLLGLEVLLARVDHPLRVGKLRARRKRKQDVVRVVVLLFEEVDVVCRDDAYAELPAERKDGIRHIALAGVQLVELVYRRGGYLLAVAFALPRRMQHDLKGVVVAKEVLVPSGDLLGLLRVVPALHGRVEVVGDLARYARRRAVQPLVVLLEKLVVDSRIVVVAVDVRLGDKPHEVVVADEVLRVQAEVEALLLLLLVETEVFVAFPVVMVDDVRLDADDRLYALLPGLVVERLRREEIAVVRHGERSHAKRLRPGDERHDPALPVEKRICRV